MPTFSGPAEDVAARSLEEVARLERQSCRPDRAGRFRARRFRGLPTHRPQAHRDRGQARPECIAVGSQPEGARVEGMTPARARSRRRWARWFAALAGLLVVAYAGLIGYLLANERALIFRPPRTLALVAGSLRLEPESIESDHARRRAHGGMARAIPPPVAPLDALPARQRRDDPVRRQRAALSPAAEPRDQRPRARVPRVRQRRRRTQRERRA